MLYTEAAVRMNLRNREGKRVFYLGRGDTLTPGARDWLSRERVEILPTEMAKPEEFRLLSGAVIREKPEHMTHLRGDVLVQKTHPRIGFRGWIDALEAELMLCQLKCEKWRKELGEILALARALMLNRCRTVARQAELAAAAAFTDENGNCSRVDILRALNRMSSMIYILMIREKTGR